MDSSSSSFQVVESAETMLKAIFLPFISKSHLLYVVDMARLFAMHNVDVTIITTPANVTLFQTSIDRDSSRGRAIRTHLVKFPQIPGLPHGVEMIDVDTANDFQELLFQGLFLLKENFQQLIRDMKPDFIVTDMFYPWSVDVAAELGIPRLNCAGGSYFSHAAGNSIEQFAPHVNVGSDYETFLLPGLPHKVEMTRSQLSNWVKEPNNEFGYMMKMIKDADKKSYGSLFRSFYELEGTYEEHYQRVTGTRSWSFGPVSIWMNQDDFDKANRGQRAKEEEDKENGVLKWLDSKKENSVVYVSFGSMIKFPISQHIEIANALEDSGYDFIWVVRKTTEEGGEEHGTILEEFEKRVKESNKGYLIWGWAPQLVILEHSAIGAVVTHCGWNTTLESVYAGLPMVTWPLFAEQFYNEKLLVDVLKIGVSVGAKKWKNLNEYGEDNAVKKEDIGKAITLLMGGGDECLEIRKKVKEFSDAAKKTIKVGGSSHTNLKQLLQELKSFKHQKANHQMEGQV
ncbi:soyasapogenol B glucuronide galactosyltransferase [Trifolium repens]|nr:soyasapogenol B glucuronide galactosyltransferase [Trifolium repens]